MSEPATNKRQTIDITEFERRLRGSGPAAANREDPLAELARLVGTDRDPFQNVFAAPPARAPAPGAAVPTPNPQKREQRFEDFLDSSPPAPSPRLVDTRGTFDPNAEHHEIAAQYAAHDEARYEGEDEASPWAEDDAEPAMGDIDAVEPPRHSNRALIFVAAGLVIVLGGIGGTFAFRHAAFLAGPPPTIVADSTPVKVRPPASANPQDDSAPAASVLGGDGSNNGPTHVVNSTEQPVDFAASTTADHVEVAGSGDPSAAGAATIFPITKRVKTFSVRPDGTIIDGQGTAGQPEASTASQFADADPADSSASAPPASVVPLFAQPVGEPPADQPTPVVQTAPAAQEAPVAPAVPLRQARPASRARVANDPTSSIPASSPPAGAPSVRRQVASRTPARFTTPRIESAPVDSSAPLQLDSAAGTPARSARAIDPFETAANEPAPLAGAAGGSGAYSLQLAAPYTQDAAHTTWAKLQKKFPDQLGDMQPNILAANNNGHHFFRLRTAYMSAQEANALCAKLKAGGGNCFVTRN